MEVTSGEFAGKQFSFYNFNLYVWGYHLSKASLMYNVKSEDEFFVEIGETIIGKEPNIKRAWMGGGVGIEQPVTPGKITFSLSLIHI